MGSTSDDGVSRHLKVLLPSSSPKLRISGDLARRLDGTAVLVSPMGSKVWRVEVGRDDNGSFLGRRWPEFVAAHGIMDWWFLVFRHEGAGVLTVKAFDTSCCLREFSRPLNDAANRIDTAGRCRRPQFIKVLLRGFTKNMAIPPDFVHRHITEEAEANSRPAALLSLCGKYWRVKVDRDQSGNVFFSGGGWSRFLASNEIIQGEALILRYEGNLVFTVKVFGLDGCQKSFKSTKTSGLQQEVGQKMEEEEGAPSLSAWKRKKTNEVPTNAETKRPARRSTTPSNKGSETAGGNICTYGNFSTYDIGPPSWIKMEINAYALKQRLRLAPRFCKAIGFLQPCEITLRTTWTGKDNTSGSWQVSGRVYSRFNDPPNLGKGWMSFCRDNELKEGDVCTFKITEPTLWHVDIARSSS